MFEFVTMQEERKQAFIKHLLYATYITLATVFNFYNLRR